MSVQILGYNNKNNFKLNLMYKLIIIPSVTIYTYLIYQLDA